MQNCRMRILWLWLAFLSAAPAWGAHAYAQFGDIKYPPGFTHFDYVNPNAPKGGKFRMVPPTRPSNFDKFNPYTLKGNAPYGLSSGGLGYSLVFESLLTGNNEERTTAYGLLAEDVTSAPDDLSVTFRLNPKARLSNGQPVLAADVVHSFQTLTSKYVTPSYPAVLSQVKRAVALDQRTVRFDFAAPDRTLPLIVGGLPIFSREWGKGKPFDQVTNELPIGSGPYLIPTPALGRDITYVRDKNYWGADLPVRKGQFNFDRITFKIYLDQTAQFEGLKAGEIDFMREFTSRNWARQYYGRVFDRGDVVKRAFENRNPAMYQATLLNLRNPKFKDIRVRRALGLAFDFQWLNRQLFYGIYSRTEDFFPNSEFQAKGLPGPDELALLEPWRAKLRPEVFGPAVVMPSTDPPSSLRDNLVQARALLAENGLDAEGELILRRQLKADGGSRAWVNDQPVSATLLRDLGATLVEVHGQHDDRGLLQPRGHMKLLDSFGGYGGQVAATATAHAAWREAVARYDALVAQVEADARDREWLDHAVAELAALAPKAGEEEALATERTAMQQGARLADDLNTINDLLDGSDGGLAKLRQVARRLERLAPERSELADALAAIDRALNEAGEAEDALAAAARAMAFDPARLDSVETRLFELRAMARKHRVTADALPELASELAARAAALQAGEAGVAGAVHRFVLQRLGDRVEERQRGGLLDVAEDDRADVVEAVCDVRVVGVDLAALHAEHLAATARLEHPVGEALDVIAERRLHPLVLAGGETIDRHHQAVDDEALSRGHQWGSSGARPAAA